LDCLSELPATTRPHAENRRLRFNRSDGWSRGLVSAGTSGLEQRLPVESFTYLVGKRAFDICFAALALILTAPLMLLISVAIKLSSPGPVFFRQQRVGLSGRTFFMYKFRTMQHNGPGGSDHLWTKRDDPRRTRLGRWLRAASLDELPQFFNVLNGEMSVVGPRPERPYFVEQFMQTVSLYNTRHNLKVGITGWAQVNGWRGDTSIAKRVEHDLYYLNNWSSGFDLRIILLTILHLFSPKNAY
jgi:exopolysaccharide biosynthesis polyprenyl glycosylphosphotransferase